MRSEFIDWTNSEYFHFVYVYESPFGSVCVCEPQKQIKQVLHFILFFKVEQRKNLRICFELEPLIEF